MDDGKFKVRETNYIVVENVDLMIVFTNLSRIWEEHRSRNENHHRRISKPTPIQVMLVSARGRDVVGVMETGFAKRWHF